MSDLKAIRQHWDRQAALGEKAGTQDLIAKELEQRAILAQIDSRDLGAYRPTPTPTRYRVSRILEVGCGRGDTARRVWELVPVAKVVAVDASAAMIEAAHRLALDCSGGLSFGVCDAIDPPPGPFDLIYTQRCLINLPTWELQKQAIDAIADRLVSGGRFLMCEASQNGLDAINERRVSLSLSAIERPWHNRYIRQHEISTITSLRLREVQNFSATYYYNSRIANAYQAQAKGEQPDYDAPINRMALEQPADDVHPKYAQSRLWVWEKL